MRYVLAPLLLLLLSACGSERSPSASSQHLGDAIRARETEMLAAIASKDAAAVAAFYAPDAQMFSPGIAHIAPDEIRAAYNGLFADPNGSVQFKSDSMLIPSSGEFVISQGKYIANYSDPKSHQRVSQTGTFINIWSRVEDGSWRIWRDVTTPAPSPDIRP